MDDGIDEWAVFSATQAIFAIFLFSSCGEVAKSDPEKIQEVFAAINDDIKIVIA